LVPGARGTPAGRRWRAAQRGPGNT